MQFHCTIAYHRALKNTDNKKYTNLKLSEQYGNYLEILLFLYQTGTLNIPVESFAH